MTTIRFKPKPVWHESAGIDGSTGRPFCVAESPHALLIRLKGTRQVLSLPWGVAYTRAAWLRAGLIRLQKINERKARRGRKGRS